MVATSGRIRIGRSSMPEPPPSDFQGLADKAVLALCELLALLFGLPFGEDLYNDRPHTGWHLFYLAIAIVFALAGPMWPWIRTMTWLPETISASFSRAALDARIWIASLLLLFIYGTGPELYRRAIEPTPTRPAAGKLWPPLTDNEKASLERALKAVSKHGSIRIICLSSDCRELAENFIGAFHNARWTPVAAFSLTGGGIYVEPVGIKLYQKDINDRTLADAIENSTNLKIEGIELTSDPAWESLFIGIRP